MSEPVEPTCPNCESELSPIHRAVPIFLCGNYPEPNGINVLENPTCDEIKRLRNELAERERSRVAFRDLCDERTIELEQVEAKLARAMKIVEAAQRWKSNRKMIDEMELLDTLDEYEKGEA